MIFFIELWSKTTDNVFTTFTKIVFIYFISIHIFFTNLWIKYLKIYILRVIFLACTTNNELKRVINMIQFYFYPLHSKKKLKTKQYGYLKNKSINLVKRRKTLLARGWELPLIISFEVTSRLLFFYNIRRKQRLQFRGVINMHSAVLW